MSQLFFISSPLTSLSTRKNESLLERSSSKTSRNYRSLTWRCCETQPATTPVAPQTQEEVDKLFSRLTHVNKNLRTKACASLATLGDESTINRLMSLLDVEDLIHRRAAVKALGMTGLPVLPSILSTLKESPNATVRASCSKALAAIALFFPEQRSNFPLEALEALEAALRDDPHPVTRIATVGCLGTLGSDIKGKDGSVLAAGSAQALDILLKWSDKASDMAVAATAIGALAQIGQNGTSETKETVLNTLKRLANGDGSEDDPESGLSYIREMAASHVDQLESGTRVPPQNQDLTQ